MVKKSLAAEANIIPSNPGAGLPVGFNGPAPLAVSDSLWQPSAYVQFISRKGQAFATVAAHVPGLDEGDPVLIRGEKVKPIKLNPFRFYLIGAFQHFSAVDGMGTITKTVLSKDAVQSDPGTKYLEHLETCIIVLADGELVPARCTFKSTKINPAHTAVSTLREATETENWASRGEAYKLSCSVAQPWGRFFTTVTLKRGVSRANGFAYVAAGGFVTPTGPVEWKALADFFEGEENQKLCDAAYRRWEERVREIKQKAV